MKAVAAVFAVCLVVCAASNINLLNHFDGSGTRPSRKQRSHCSHLHSLFLNLHESSKMTTSISTYTHGCMSLTQGPDDKEDPCNMFEPGSKQHTETLQEMGLNALKQQYENTETALCSEIIDRMMPSILNDDAVTQSSNFPAGVFKASSLKECYELKQTQTKLDHMWRTAIQESKYVQSDVETGDQEEKKDDGGNEGVQMEDSVSGTPTSIEAEAEADGNTNANANAREDSTASATHEARFHAARNVVDKGAELEHAEIAAERKENIEEARRERLAAKQQRDYAKALHHQVVELERQVKDGNDVVSTPTHAPTFLELSGSPTSWWSDDESECEDRVNKLTSIDYNQLRDDYDQLNSKCTDAQAELKQFIRMQLSQPRKNVEPPELQVFFSTQGLPVNLDQGLCNLYQNDKSTASLKEDSDGTETEDGSGCKSCVEKKGKWCYDVEKNAPAHCATSRFFASTCKDKKFKGLKWKEVKKIAECASVKDYDPKSIDVPDISIAIVQLIDNGASVGGDNANELYENKYLLSEGDGNQVSFPPDNEESTPGHEEKLKYSDLAHETTGTPDCTVEIKPNAAQQDWSVIKDVCVDGAWRATGIAEVDPSDRSISKVYVTGGVAVRFEFISKDKKGQTMKLDNTGFTCESKDKKFTVCDLASVSPKAGRIVWMVAGQQNDDTARSTPMLNAAESAPD